MTANTAEIVIRLSIPVYRETSFYREDANTQTHMKRQPTDEKGGSVTGSKYLIDRRCGTAVSERKAIFGGGWPLYSAVILWWSAGTTYRKRPPVDPLTAAVSAVGTGRCTVLPSSGGVRYCVPETVPGWLLNGRSWLAAGCGILGKTTSRQRTTCSSLAIIFDEYNYSPSPHLRWR